MTGNKGLSDDTCPEGLREVLSPLVKSRLPRRLRRHIGFSDALQSVAFAAQTRGHQFRGATPSDYQRWLFRIARNKIVDSMRWYRERTSPPMLPEVKFVNALQTTTDRTADSQIVMTQQSRLTLESIAVLLAGLRRTFVLGNACELGFADIAFHLDTAKTTFRQRRFAGLRLLGDMLR